MKISQEAVTDTNFVRDYGDGFLLIQTVDGESRHITEASLLSANHCLPASEFPNHQSLSEYLKTQQCDLLILVSKAEMDMSLYQQAQQYTQAGVVAEVMSLGPACRTFNLLVSEGRFPALFIVF